MNIEELESLLEGGQETQGIEFKESMPWSIKKFARALLAMANVEDGGVIIIGVTDEGARQGLVPEDLKTYDLDIMRDQMNAYADPHVEFTFIPGEDASGKAYAIIRVKSFREIPVLCCKDDDEAKTQDGKIYYRNTNRRPESAPVSNSYDMRTIVEVAALRMMRKFEERGVRTGTPSNKASDEELEGLQVMKEGLIEKIRSRGYIRVNFRPMAYEERRVSLPDCENLVKENAVRLRGWNYPHFPQRRGDDTGLDKENDFIQGWIDWSIHREFWRIYRSGQFLHYKAYPEDWYDEIHFPGQVIDPNSVLEVGGTIVFGLTEVFEFLKRLAVSELYEDGAWVSIQFHGLKNRKLWVDDPKKAPFLTPKASSSESFKWVGALSSTDIVTRVQENALKVIEDLVYRFGWRNIAVDAIRAQQLQFLSGEHSVG